jgi:chloride channel protein, CIC family
MKVADLMQTTLVTVSSDSIVSEAVVSLADAHVTGLPVVDLTGRLVGVLSTSDILTALAEQQDPDGRTLFFETTSVRDLMTPRPVTIAPGADAHEAAQQMLYANVHRLFVEEAGELVGVISQSDIVRAVANARV